MLFAEPDYVKKVITYDVLNHLGLNFQKSLKINFGSSGLMVYFTSDQFYWYFGRVF